MKALSLLPSLVKNIAKVKFTPDRQTGGQTNRPTDGVIPIYPPKLHLQGVGWGCQLLCTMQLHVYERKYNYVPLASYFIFVGLG